MLLSYLFHIHTIIYIITDKYTKKAISKAIGTPKLLLIDIVGNAKAVILPSEWYENGPYSAIEAIQCGRPIIGSQIGGIPELIDGNGFSFAHGDVDALAEILKTFPEAGTEEHKALCEKSRELFARNHMADSHYPVLEKIYNKAIDLHK